MLFQFTARLECEVQILWALLLAVQLYTESWCHNHAVKHIYDTQRVLPALGLCQLVLRSCTICIDG